MCVIVVVMDVVGCLRLYRSPSPVIMIFWRVGVFIVLVGPWVLSEDEGVDTFDFWVGHMFAVVQ